MSIFQVAGSSELFEQGSFMGRILEQWLKDGEVFVGIKLPHILAIACLAFLLIKLLHLAATRVVVAAERHASGPSRITEVRSLSGVIRATGLAVIALIAALQILDVLGINLYPLLASAGVAGVALGLASQSLGKDLLNGAIMLVEGHFSVGDRVSLAGVTGTVESMTLRKTTLRAPDNTVYVIPNSQITTVANLGVANLGYGATQPKTEGESGSTQPENIDRVTMKRVESENPFQ